jgi:hypothetical protein
MQPTLRDRGPSRRHDPDTVSDDARPISFVATDEVGDRRDDRQREQDRDRGRNSKGHGHPGRLGTDATYGQALYDQP